jgi:hypothetical protein
LRAIPHNNGRFDVRLFGPEPDRAELLPLARAIADIDAPRKIAALRNFCDYLLRYKKPWADFPLRLCRKRGFGFRCLICPAWIRFGDYYRDAGGEARAHEQCAENAARVII